MWNASDSFGLLVTSVNSGIVCHVRGSLKSLLLRVTYVQVVVQNSFFNIQNNYYDDVLILLSSGPELCNCEKVLIS